MVRSWHWFKTQLARAFTWRLPIQHMPKSEEGHLALAKEKLRRFLILADEILSLRQAVQHRLGESFPSGAMQDTLRNRVLIGLNLKALDSFERLVVDARDRRGESSHHLKTMAECFIYSHWASRDLGEQRARILYAEGCRSRAVYHENCSDSAEDAEHAVAWRELHRGQISGIESDWSAFRDVGLQQLASQAELEDHYHKVYRLACEAAHMGDLMVYMPPQPQEAGLTLADLSLLRAYVSLKFGVILACDLLNDASDSLGMDAAGQIDGFRERWRAIQSLAS